LEQLAQRNARLLLDHLQHHGPLGGLLVKLPLPRHVERGEDGKDGERSPRLQHDASASKQPRRPEDHNSSFPATETTVTVTGKKGVKKEGRRERGRPRRAARGPA